MIEFPKNKLSYRKETGRPLFPSSTVDGVLREVLAVLFGVCGSNLTEDGTVKPWIIVIKAKKTRWLRW